MWEYDKNVLSFVERKKKRIYEFLAALRVTSLLTRRFKGSHFYPLSFHARYARTVHLNPVFLIEASIPATIHVQRALSPLFSRAFALSFEKYFYVQPYLSFTRLGTGSRNSFVDLRFKSRLRGNGAASVSAFFFFFFWPTNISHPLRIKVELLPFDVREKSSLVSGGWRSRSLRFYESHLAGNTSGLIAPSGPSPGGSWSAESASRLYKDISKTSCWHSTCTGIIVSNQRKKQILNTINVDRYPNIRGKY